MASNRLAVPRALALALLLPLALGACGRKGPLDPPPSAAIPAPPQAASGSPAASTALIDPTTPTGGAQPARPAPVPTTEAGSVPAKKTFLLDPLIQ